MHPIELLRYIVRADGADQGALAAATAQGLSEFDGPAPALLNACTAILRYHPSAASVVWVCARVLASADPQRGAWDAAMEIELDATETNLIALVANRLDDKAETPEAQSRRAPVVVEARAVGAGQGDSIVMARAEAERGGLVLAESFDSFPNSATSPIGFGGSGVDRRDAAETVSELDVVVLAPVGRVLPTNLYRGLVRRIDSSNPGAREADYVEVDRGRVASFVCPEGVFDSRFDLPTSCPGLHELC